MQYRRLGNSGLQVSALSFGAWLTFGQQSWIRLLGIEHHQYLAGTAAAMAPGFESADALSQTKGRADYWAGSPAT